MWLDYIFPLAAERRLSPVTLSSWHGVPSPHLPCGHVRHLHLRNQVFSYVQLRSIMYGGIRKRLNNQGCKVSKMKARPRHSLCNQGSTENSHHGQGLFRHRGG